MSHVRGEELVGGRGAGRVLFADVGLSFWGGVDPLSSQVVDHTHPLFGKDVRDTVLAIPNGRGSCTGSQVVLELILNGIAPAALVLRQPDAILALGVVVAEELFGKSIPIVSVGDEQFSRLGDSGCQFASVEAGDVVVGKSEEAVQKLLSQRRPSAPSSADELLQRSGLQLTEEEKDMLSGNKGEATAVAMRVVARAAAIDGAPSLLKVRQAHIDGCTYIGPGGLRFAQTLAEMGGKVAVPTTLNSNSVDRRQWRSLGVSPQLGEPAQALGDAYLEMGCSDTSFTCAPYLLSSKPKLGDQIAWGESNAVVYANSVIGARTQKYADYLDICAAITGRVPLSGPHLDDERRAKVVLDVSQLVADVGSVAKDTLFPVLGYLCGLRSEADVPVVVGLEDVPYHGDDLKAFSAAFGSTAAVAMFHIAGVTPESLSGPDEALGGLPPRQTVELTKSDFAEAWQLLDSGAQDAEAIDDVQLVALGNPHFSLTECERLVDCIAETDEVATVADNVNMVITMGRDVFDKASAKGYIDTLQEFGATFITDTCWCMLTEPVVPVNAQTLVTNSAKYAHYGPGLVGKRVRFSSIAGCVSAAQTGQVVGQPSFARRSFSTSCIHHNSMGSFSRSLRVGAQLLMRALRR